MQSLLASQKSNQSRSSLSFASPESDFSGPTFYELQTRTEAKGREEAPQYSKMNFASAESDWCANHLNETSYADNNSNDGVEYLHHIIGNTGISFTTPDIDFCVDESILKEIQTKKSSKKELFANIPRTFASVSNSNDIFSAVVITEACSPYRIIDVNDAWVNLCGYQKEEVIGKTLEVIQGPETDRQRLADVINALRAGHDAEVTVFNYTKNKEKFRNHLKVVPLVSEKNSAWVTHFMGVLTRVS